MKNKKPMLLPTMNASLLVLTGSGTAPTEIRIPYRDVPYSRDGVHGVQRLDKAAAELLRGTWNAWRTDDPRGAAGTPIYVGHPDYTAGDPQAELTLTQKQPPSLGWMVDIRVELDAMILKIEWTQRGRELVESKEYRFVSPYFLSERSDMPGSTILVPRYIRSVGLTNTPNWPQAPLVNSANANDGGAEEVNTEMTLLERLGKALGKSYATEDDAVTAVETIHAASARVVTLEADNTALKDTVNTLRTSYATQIVHAQVARGAVLQAHAQTRIADLVNSGGSLADRVKELESLPPLMKTESTVNTADLSKRSTNDAETRQKIVDLVHAKMHSEHLGYDAAFTAVQRDHKELFATPTA